MKVAVTGGTGLVGRRLIPALRRRGHELKVLVRPRPGRILEELEGVEWVEGRLDELEPIERLVEGCDLVLHGAYLHPEEPPLPERSIAEHYVLSNFVGSMRLLERTPALPGKQLIYVSTLAVFGHDPNQDPRGERFPRDEDFPLWPTQYYGAMRAAVEKMVVAAASAYQLNTCVFRLGCVLGNRERWSEIPIAPQVEEAIEHGEIRSRLGAYAIDVEDSAEILADAVGDETLRGQVFNTFDRWIDFAEMAPCLSRILGKEVRVACEPAPEPRSPILGERIHARYDRFRTWERLEELLAILVERYRSRAT